jgi:C4-dicarboxylate transporter, DctQ subunit
VKLFRALARTAEAVAAGLLAVIFLAFIAQIALRDEEEIRIELLRAFFGPRGQRILSSLGSIAIVVLFALALPATWDYITFMKVESSSYLKIRFDWLYSIYLVFAVAVIARHLWLVVNALRGRAPSEATHIGSL